MSRLSRKTFIELGAILAVAALTLCICFWQLQRIGESGKQALVRMGEPITLAQALPPPVPAAENGADICLKAFALLKADTSTFQSNYCSAMQMVGPGQARVCSQLPQAVGYDFTNSWADMSLAVAQNQPALALLQKIVEHPHLDFHIPYEKGMSDEFDFNTLHMTELKGAAQCLSTAAMCELHDGNVTEALKNQRAMLVLARALLGQRFSISELVGFSILFIAEGTTWELLQTPGLTEAQLAVLQQDWHGLDLVRGWHDAVAMEFITSDIALQRSRRALSTPAPYLGIGKSPVALLGMWIDDPTAEPLVKIKAGAKVFAWRFWWSYSDEQLADKGYAVLLGASRCLITNENFQIAIAQENSGLAALRIPSLTNSILYEGDLETVDFHLISSLGMTMLSKMLDKVMRVEASRQMTVTAIALQRFKLKHGHFPADLMDLVPEFLPAVPTDPADGLKLQYRLQSSGTYLLYSAGINGVDDGGNPASPASSGTPSIQWLGMKAADWVWPQPATNAVQ